MDRFGLWNLGPSSPMNRAVAFNIQSHEGIQGCLSTSTPTLLITGTLGAFLHLPQEATTKQ